MNLIRLLRRFLRPYVGWIVVVVCLQLVASISGLYLPTLNARIIDDGVAVGDIGLIWRTGAIMLGASLLQLGCQAAAVYFGARAAMAFGRDVRGAIFDRVLSFSARELNSFGAPTLITRNTNDVQQVQMLVVMAATLLVAAPITMIGGVVLAVREDIGLSWLIVVAVAVLVGLIAVIVSRMGPLFRRMQENIDGVNRVLREQIMGIRVVRAFVREDYEAARFDRASVALAEVATSAGRWMAAMFPIVMGVANLSSVAVVWFGAARIVEGQLQVGQLTAYIAYLIQILMSVMMATFLFVMAPRAAVSADRIGQVLATGSSVDFDPDGVTALPEPGRVDFDRVSFTYPGADAPVLRDISFSAHPGQTTAIIGSTGAGKTTLISLVPRFFDATAGTVSVGGVPVREIAADALWRSLALVPQKAFLFSGTVASNLRYGNPDATDDELWRALEVAQAADFVADLPEGLDAPISQGGTNVSGGQRQRLSIARALVARAKILIFDDSFSALDVATDARLRGALRAETRDAAVIMVGQRIATVRDADQIVVLEHGEVVGIGTHQELLETCETYVEIVASQLSAEEAAA
ncbi:ATP-binding cassette subfamily B protein [Naumannella cuiyingiana]|uniref:ATP-binding cassette subfamily B protein n=1 Tax=Naumannella cuiyingiana TaxID=1347891 RepID=A0A7Z0D641_9ACTN|nr:ABC transporter ATP-binding protein [Naumannella cuiyingiana]NYI69611.1 ATP-binding cassette subfamily B protein [Naumannella cuiyingiana]